MFDDLGFEQSDDGFGQCVVVAVSDSSDRHVDSGFGEPIALWKTRGDSVISKFGLAEFLRKAPP